MNRAQTPLIRSSVRRKNLRVSVDLGASVVKFFAGKSTTEAPRSTETRRGDFKYLIARNGKALAILLLLIVSILPAAIAKDAQPNEDPQIEQRMKLLTEQLRCLVCQNETLADSRADLAEDLRKQIREQMKAGKTDKEIIDYLTARYGDFVLYNPPIKATTYLLWFGPFVLLIGGTLVLFRFLKQRRQLIKEVPLSAEDQKRAEEMLRSV